MDPTCQLEREATSLKVYKEIRNTHFGIHTHYVIIFQKCNKVEKPFQHRKININELLPQQNNYPEA